MAFKKAERRSVKIKLQLTGPTGSGKTYSALRLAKGLGGKIAVIDSENGSASLYSDFFDFDVIDLKPPFTTEKYIEAINDAEKSGYTSIIIDSLTHAWAGEGGLLEQKAQLDARPGSNHWTNWGPIDKKDQALKNAFLHSTCHIIATSRSKMDYMQSGGDGEKKKVQKVGMAPVQRDGLSYDFTIVFDIAMNNECEVSKDRTSLFAGKIFRITEETGQTIVKWLESGKAPEPVPLPPAQPPQVQGKQPQTGSAAKTPPRPINKPTLAQIKGVIAHAEGIGYHRTHLDDVMNLVSGCAMWNQLTNEQLQKVTEYCTQTTPKVSEEEIYGDPEGLSDQEKTDLANLDPVNF